MQNQYASPMIEDFRVSLLAMEHLLAIGGVDEDCWALELN